MQRRDEAFLLFFVGMAAVFALSLIAQQGLQNRVGAAYTTLDQVPSGYAPPWNPFTNIQFLTLTAASAQDEVALNVSASQEGMLFYQTFYVYDKDAPGDWRAYNFSESGTDGWVAGAATASLTLNQTTLDPESWVLVYACADVGGDWKCGCYDSADTQCQKWSVQNFAPDICEEDPLCVGRDDGELYCAADGIINCTAGADDCLAATTTDCAAQGKHCIVSGTTVSCADCADEPPANTTVDCGQPETGTLCNGTDYNVAGTKCAGSEQCVSGTCVGCVTGDDCTSGHCMSGSCVDCETASDCTTPPSGYDDECYTASCNSNTCSYETNSKDGASCTTSTGDSGTCQRGSCVVGCTPQCDPSSYTPTCGFISYPPWTTYHQVCRDDNGDSCAEIVRDNCASDQFCDPVKGCYTPVCGDGQCNGGEDATNCPSDCGSGGQPDLTVALERTPDGKINITVCNEGDAPSTKAYLSLQTGEDINHLCTADTTHSYTLAAGTCDETTFPQSYLNFLGALCNLNMGDVERAFLAIIDVNDDVTESHENNNEWSGMLCIGTCSATDGDASAADCNAATDQTTDSYPDDPDRGDQGKAWLDPWPSSAYGSPKCCGDDANEYLIYKQGDNAKQSCCASDAECLDDYGTCYAHDATTHFASGDYYCLDNWWYGCKVDDDICRIHKDDSLSGTKDCYFNSNGEYVWGDYVNPPQEVCGDGKDNDCDRQVDGHDTGDCPHYMNCNEEFNCAGMIEDYDNTADCGGGVTDYCVYNDVCVPEGINHVSRSDDRQVCHDGKFYYCGVASKDVTVPGTSYKCVYNGAYKFITS